MRRASSSLPRADRRARLGRLVASKAYYFGTGGGGDAFLGDVERDPRLAVASVARLEDGASAVRMIIEVVRRTRTPAT